MASFNHSERLVMPGLLLNHFHAACKLFLFSFSRRVIHRSCFNNRFGQARTFARAWDNRFEINKPISPCGCWTCSERCVCDSTSVIFYDRSPFIGDCWSYCFGPPVIYTLSPICICVDVSDLCGVMLMHAPCSCWGVKSGIYW